MINNGKETDSTVQGKQSARKIEIYKIFPFISNPQTWKVSLKTLYKYDLIPSLHRTRNLINSEEDQEF